VISRERFYDSIAGDFDALMNRYDLERRLEVVFDDLLGGRTLSGQTVLDVGCGTGFFTIAALRRGARVTSVDIGIELLRRARVKGATATLAGDAAALPFADGTFDVVISSECIEHTRRPELCVRDMLRVLRPNGLLVLTCPNRAWHWSVVAANALGLRPYHGLENWPGWWTLTKWTRAHGGTVVRHVGIHCFPFTLTVTHPLLRFLDRFGGLLGPLYVNQGIVAVRSAGVSTVSQGFATR
jgi:SAM-dependent methyltransferase